MEQDHRIESVLLADCGSTTTHVSLIDLIGDEFRLVAGAETATTVEAPWSRVALGVLEAVRQIEELTGRTLVDSKEQLIFPERVDGRGVDGFIATVNAAAPLGMAVVGLIRDLSVESLLKATDSSYVLVQNVVATDDMPSRGGRGPSTESMLNELLLNTPDAILIGGGVDGGAVGPVLEMVKDIAAALSGPIAGGRVHVIFAGNQDARSQVAEVLGDCSSLHVVSNVRPTLEIEDLGPSEKEIDSLYRGLKMGRVPGFTELQAWALMPVLPTAEGLGLVLRYLAREYQLDVLGVDVGGASTNIAGVVGGRYGSTVSGELGVGYSIRKVLDRAGTQRVLRWLPFEMEAEEVDNAALSKALRPMTVPQTTKDLLLEQAVAREAISLTLERAVAGWLESASSHRPGLLPAVDLIVGRGGTLCSAPQPHQAALMLLDALQPVGVCTLALDSVSLLPQLGALAEVQSLAAAQVLGRDGFLHLGTAISLVGTGREGAVALRGTMEYEDGQTIEVEVPYGSLEVMPLPQGKRAVVKLRPGSRFDVGLGKRGKGATTEVEGGAVGIIIDARGRPLVLPDDEEKRRTKIQEWMLAMGL